MSITTDWDARVGRFVYERRIEMGASQDHLAEALSEQGIAWHQMVASRVESGVRKLRAEELPALCYVLRIGIEEFFDLIPGSVKTKPIVKRPPARRNPLMEAS